MPLSLQVVRHILGPLLHTQCRLAVSLQQLAFVCQAQQEAAREGHTQRPRGIMVCKTLRTARHTYSSAQRWLVTHAC